MGALVGVYLQLRGAVSPQWFTDGLARLPADVRLGSIAFLAAIVPVYGMQLLATYWFEPTEHPVAKIIREGRLSAILALAGLRRPWWRRWPKSCCFA